MLTSRARARPRSILTCVREHVRLFFGVLCVCVCWRRRRRRRWSRGAFVRAVCARCKATSSLISGSTLRQDTLAVRTAISRSTDVLVLDVVDVVDASRATAPQLTSRHLSRSRKRAGLCTHLQRATREQQVRSRARARPRA